MSTPSQIGICSPVWVVEANRVTADSWLYNYKFKKRRLMRKIICAASLAACTAFSASSVMAAGCSKWWFSSGGYTDTQNPILLVHGFSGFDDIGGLINYFHTIPLNLCRSGADVKVASVSAYNSTELRGKQLSDDINSNRYGSSKFNVIGHSQGAPTSRVAVTFDAALHSSGQGRIKSVTSVGGANKGSKFADMVSGDLPANVQGGLAALLNAFGGLINLFSGNNDPQDALAALETLTTEGIDDLNTRHGYGVSSTYCGNDRPLTASVNGNTIRLYSWAGKSIFTNVFDITDPLLAITSRSFDGEPNDGLVSVCSQKLGQFIGTTTANHIDEINHLLGARSPFHNPVSMYRQHANRLKNAGL